jgi:murein L,D-transpeptidase YafK
MKLLRLAPLLLCLAVGTAGAEVGEGPRLPEVDRLYIDKSERWMQLWSGDRLVHIITGIQLGDAPQGHKRFEGDERTPEGRYVIDWRNPESAYHLSLHISYPNAADEAYALSQERYPGGMIMIHGQPGWLPAGRMPGDWTDGCIAVTNTEMDLLWQSVPDGAIVDIVP